MTKKDELLDDDDIIDLTDLLEEGESSKKDMPKKDQGPRHKAQMNEPDSFDLGKEISMEYDVSVEEIDHGGENLDIDGSLAPNEEVVLAREQEVKEEVILEEKEVKELDFSEDLLAEEPPPAREEAPPVPEATPNFSEDDIIRGPAPLSSAKAIPEPEALSPEPVPQDPEPLSFEDVAAPAADEAMPAGKPEGGMVIEFDRRPVDDVAGIAKMSSEDAAAELRQQIPAIIEAIVKPLMAELVKDMIAATREQLPGIVEKVIREEIEKLKKLDS